MLEKITKISLNDLEWQIAQRHPQKFLTKNLGQEPLLIEKIQKNLDNKMIHVLQQHRSSKKSASF